jgi:hypothetical protein
MSDSLIPSTRRRQSLWLCFAESSRARLTRVDLYSLV